MTSLPPTPDMQFPPKQHRRSKRNYWLIPLTFVVGIGLGIGGTSLVYYTTDSMDESASPQSAFDSPDALGEEADTEDSPEVEPDYSPVASDFEVELIVKEQECFGSAGCNVNLRVEPSYVGTEVPSGQWEITYEVTGIEDEPQIQTFTLDGSEFSYQPEIDVQTVSRSSEPTAEVTDVYEGY